MSGVAYKHNQQIGPFDPEPAVGSQVSEPKDTSGYGWKIWTLLEDGYWYDRHSDHRTTWEELRFRDDVRWYSNFRGDNHPLGWREDGSKKTLLDVLDTKQIKTPKLPPYATYIPTRTTGGKFKTHTTLGHAKAAITTATHDIGRKPHALMFQWTGSDWAVLYVVTPDTQEWPWNEQ